MNFFHLFLPFCCLGWRCSHPSPRKTLDIINFFFKCKKQTVVRILHLLRSQLFNKVITEQEKVQRREDRMIKGPELLLPSENL